MKNKLKDIFNTISNKTAYWIGTPLAFILSVLSVIIWAVMGPIFNYSDTWQLVINILTTVLIFLIVSFKQKCKLLSWLSWIFYISVLLQAVHLGIVYHYWMGLIVCTLGLIVFIVYSIYKNIQHLI